MVKIHDKFQERVYRESYMNCMAASRLAYQIQALRKQRGLSAQAFADLVGCSRSAVYRLESDGDGKTTVAMLLRIANALDVALVVHFASFAQFLESVEDNSPSGLEVPSFDPFGETTEEASNV